jgi:hypothetical protein
MLVWKRYAKVFVSTRRKILENIVRLLSVKRSFIQIHIYLSDLAQERPAKPMSPPIFTTKMA